MDQPDLIQMCMQDLQTDDQSAFTETFCKRCRNHECTRAMWVKDRFSDRVATQPERFFNPNLADPASSRYAHLKDFENVAHAVAQIEATNQRGDWTVPDLTPEALIENPTIILPPAKHIGLPQQPNTPLSPGGVMIDGSSPPATVAPVKPTPPDWSTPHPKIAGVQVVQPGAKIRLGGGSSGQGT